MFESESFSGIIIFKTHEFERQLHVFQIAPEILLVVLHTRVNCFTAVNLCWIILDTIILDGDEMLIIATADVLPSAKRIYFLIMINIIIIAFTGQIYWNLPKMDLCLDHPQQLWIIRTVNSQLWTKLDDQHHTVFQNVLTET